MHWKKWGTVLGLSLAIYGTGYVYFRQKAPTLLKMSLHTIEKSGLKVTPGKYKTGNYLFRPYVELNTLSLESSSAELPSMKISTTDPTRFMLNWWQGQSLTMTNKGQALVHIVYPHFQYELTPYWLTVTVDGVGTQPHLREMQADSMGIAFLEGNTKRNYVIKNVLARKTTKTKNAELSLQFTDVCKAEGKTSIPILSHAHLALNIPESIKHPFQAQWFLILAQSKEHIAISKLLLQWNSATFEGSGTIQVDTNQMPHITVNTSLKDFEAFLNNLNGHPLLTPLMLKTWQAALAILKVTSKSTMIVFEYKNRAVYINGIEVVKNLDL